MGTFVRIVRLIGVVALASLSGCSHPSSNGSQGGSDPTYKTDVVTFTYTKADFSPWPWTVSSMTVTCTDMAGGATAVVGGQTYGISGSEGIHSTIMGYADSGKIMLDPAHDSNPSTRPFVQRVEADCTKGMKGH